MPYLYFVFNGLCLPPQIISNAYLHILDITFVYQNLGNNKL